MKNCPFCGGEIQAAAIKCKHCKEWLDNPASITSTPQEQIGVAPTPGSNATKSRIGKSGPTGVGGWLMLLVLGMIVLGPLLGTGRIAGDIMTAERQNPEIKTLEVWNTFKSSIWIIFLAFTALSFYGGLGLVRSKDWAVVHRAQIILWITGPAATLVMSVVIPSAILGSDAVDSSFIGPLIGSTIGAGIWTSYLSKSKRVHNTYI